LYEVRLTAVFVPGRMAIPNENNPNHLYEISTAIHGFPPAE
jgi:hypothetical protein